MMVEAGLASCLAAMKSNLRRVSDVMEYLDKYHNSEADDVAVLYVQEISKDQAMRSSLKANPTLVNLLIKMLDEGWTSAEEKDAVHWLRSLQRGAS